MLHSRVGSATHTSVVAVASIAISAALFLKLPVGAAAESSAVTEDGIVHIPALEVPLSVYMSDEAKRKFIQAARKSRTTDSGPDRSIAEIRASVDKEMRAKVKHLQSLYAVKVSQETIAGVRTDVVTPSGELPLRNRDRVLINLHGGGFSVGGVWHGIVESIPVSSIGKFKVITVDYRMAPEYHFPAASEDVSSVYSMLLQQYRPESIGIYGCSAGGSLTAMTAAWLQKEGKPAPGAIAILSAAAFAGFGADPANAGSWGGDSRYLGPALMGEKSWIAQIPYLNKADLRDPLVSPGVSPSVLAKFPPTLLVTGTRAYDLSAAVQTQRELTRAGVEADLHLWDGLGHCFFLDEDLPESREAYEVVAKFFERHLGKRR